MEWSLASILIPAIFGFVCGTEPLVLPPFRDPHDGDPFWRLYGPNCHFCSGLVGAAGAVLITRILGQNFVTYGFFPLAITAGAAGFVTSHLVGGIGDMFRKP